MCVCLSVCVSTPEGINNQRCDVGCVLLVKQVLQLFTAFNYFMTLAVDKIDGHGHINTAHRKHLPKKTKVTWY